MSLEVVIDGRKIGADHEPYIICELSGNHNGSLDRALKMIDAAAETGCDAIKLQTYTADTITLDSDRPEFYLHGGPWDGRSLYELYEEAHTPWDWHPALFERAKKHGVTMFSSPFDETAVDLLAGLEAPAYKIASFELVDLPLVAYVAQQGKPMIMSTGMANAREIDAAVQTARKFGTGEIILLHCVSEYPANIADANVRTVPDLGRKFGCVSGLSDHTFGTAASVASVAVGGCVIEKHFTLARADGGPDSGFSLEPAEFAALVRDCKDAWRALGRVHYETLGTEQGSKTFRRSLYVVKDVKAGEALTKDNIRSIRPGLGLPPSRLWDVVGKAASRDLMRGEPLADDMISL
ncbi:pseudaminic acid synthase [Asticcacaulis benevestitus]|uniref:N-acetylneuraminate synthase n=1 Tax=Asticcacaulis benevestitus DSM 16100 = ATCC BAA-896 TaxID=1121022 RepID=V4PYG6_9CAUL|nr:pseudaminic acid synthase [Asticcacaulis benevestitus]ESQ93441.1 N-acetylneuraminate synthase [Asticcacaulis benevestitus DSM 16100 = ATCC BAA-896]